MALKSSPSLLAHLADPGVMFAEDVMEDTHAAPALTERGRVPILRIFRRGEGTLGVPDIVTRRTEAYIVGWDEDTTEPDEA